VKLPRDVTASELVRALTRFGYVVTRQTGSHIRMTTAEGGQHHEAIPNHRPIKAGTLHGILKSVADHHQMTVEELLNELDL
jgi:predicted RNA binding protein YcfA (HicA-like mRNA interferase family)